MRVIKEDLIYLVETTTEDGKKEDKELFAEREVRLVEHGWRESKFGETTEEGIELVSSLRQYADDHFLLEDLYEDEYPEQVKRYTLRIGVDELLREVGFEEYI